MTAIATTEAAVAPVVTRSRSRAPGRGRRPLLIVLQVAIVAVLLTTWELGSSMGWISSFLFSSPSGIAEVLSNASASGALWTDIGTTAYETAIGFLIGAIGGSILGLALWYSRFVADLSAPFVAAIGSIPVLSIAPIMIIWFGTGVMSKIVIVAFSCIIVALTNSYRGAQRADRDLLNLMRSFGASKSQAFLKVVVPGAMPWVVNGFKLNVGFAIIGAIVGEYISSQAGIGHMIVIGSGSFQMNVVLAGVVVVMAMVIVFSLLISLLERTLLHWER